MGLGHDNSTQLHHLVSLMSRNSDQILQEQLGIGLSQYKILTTLHEQPHVQQRVIADTLGQTEASISRQIKLLQEKGMLQAVQNPDNRRQHLADLTPKGLHLIEAAEQVLKNFHADFFTSLSTKQQTQLHEILEILHRSVCYLNHPSVEET